MEREVVAGDVADPEEDEEDSEVAVDEVVEEASNEVLKRNWRSEAIGYSLSILTSRELEHRKSFHMHGLRVHLAFVVTKTGNRNVRKAIMHRRVSLALYCIAEPDDIRHILTICSFSQPPFFPLLPTVSAVNPSPHFLICSLTISGLFCAQRRIYAQPRFLPKICGKESSNRLVTSIPSSPPA